MSTTPIIQALNGERLVALSPGNASEAASDWLRRPNLFSGRALTADTLNQRQAWQSGRLAQRAQAFTPGVVRGLEVGWTEEGVDNNGAPIIRLHVSDGLALAVSGEDVSLGRAISFNLLDVPVVAPPSLFAAALNAAQLEAINKRARAASGALIARAIGPSMRSLRAAGVSLPDVGILVLQAISVDRSDFDPSDPCDRCPCEDGSESDPGNYEDWRIADGVRLLWYAWPEEWLALPPPMRLRNRLADKIFGAEAALGHGKTLPWEPWGVAIAAIALDAQARPQFCDRNAVVRQGGRARDARLQLAAGGKMLLAANSRLPAMWQARIEQFAEQIAEAGEPAPPAATLAQQFAFLPPFGLLPRDAYDFASQRSDFFPSGIDLDAVPIPVDQLDIAVRGCASLAPINLSLPESVRLLVPVPAADWDPQLLQPIDVSNEFTLTLNRFLAVRARQLGYRQGLRVKQAALTHALSGSWPLVEAFDADPLAIEAESLAPFGPPPDAGGHRSALIHDVLHQHYFQNASETFSVGAGEALYCWVYLDPEHPPRQLMLQWLEGSSFEHRAYWGENLIELGSDGTASRLAVDDLPEAGRWIRLQLPASSVGLNGKTLSGMAFTLFGGRAVFGPCGAITSNSERMWFANVLPRGAQTLGDEAWEMLSPNELWAPLESAYGLTPASDASAPTGGGHVEPLAKGTHQHFFTAAAPLVLASGDSLYCWVYLDPLEPPRTLMLQWNTASSNWEHRAFWGENLINWGSTGSASRRYMGDLPPLGQWVQLKVPAADVGLPSGNVSGMAFTLFDGTAAFAAAGALSSANADKPWFSNSLPAGAVPQGSWQFLSDLQLKSPTAAAHSGYVEDILRLKSNPSLAALSGAERAQLHVRGLEGFISYLSSRTDRADDIVDHSFVKVQTDVYRVRQLMLGNTEATRLATSPALAAIAKADTALASQTQIASFLQTLKAPQASAASAAAPVNTSSSGGASSSAAPMALSYMAMPIVPMFFGTVTPSAPAPASNNLQKATKISSATSFINQQTQARAIIKSGPSPFEVANAAPVVGSTSIRTSTVAKRLEDPKSQEARDYAMASRYEAVHSLIRLADELMAEDAGESSGLFEGVTLHGLRGDPFALPDPDAGDAIVPPADTTTPAEIAKLNALPRKITLTSLFPSAVRASKLNLLLRTPKRSITPDEATHFSDTSDMSDYTIALMRQMEGRIKLYRDAISACQSVLDGLKRQQQGLAARLGALAEELAEARQDVSVARALLAEETERINAIKARRASVINEHVKFLAFVRARETDNLAAAPRVDLDPGLIDPPVPACLAAHHDMPDELSDMLRVLREAPAAWFSDVPALVDKITRVEPLIKLLQTAQMRSQISVARPIGASIVSSGKFGASIARVAQSHNSLLNNRMLQAQALNISQLASSTWQSVRNSAVQVVSLGDLAEGEHGTADVARKAAAVYEDMGRIVACLHAEFSAVLPAIRLDWAETLSQFDEAPNLRNLGSLAHWSEIDYIDRRQMQSYVDWLFARVDYKEPKAVALINDVIRMALLLASHAPVGRIIAGSLQRAVTGVRPGTRLPLASFDTTRLRVGMQALVYKAGALVARAKVEDIGRGEVSATVIHTVASSVDLGADVRIQFAEATAVSLGGKGLKLF